MTYSDVVQFIRDSGGYFLAHGYRSMPVFLQCPVFFLEGDDAVVMVYTNDRGKAVRLAYPRNSYSQILFGVVEEARRV